MTPATLEYPFTPFVPRERHFAGFWIRGAALLFDGLIVIGFQLLLEYLTVAFTDSTAAAVYVQLVALLIDMVYYCYFWTHSGATPGKIVLGLKVIDADTGGPLRTGQAIKRWFAQILSGALFGYGFFKALWSPEKAATHDRIARTRVIYAE